MSVDERIRRWRRAAARRRIAIVLAIATPPALVLVVLGARLGGAAVGMLLVVMVVAAFGIAAWQTARRIDAHWIARRLDAAAPRMEDSAALLFADESRLSGLERLQRARLRARLHDLEADLRPAWPWRILVASAALSIAILAIAAAWSVRGSGAGPSDEIARTTAGSSTAITATELRIEPPSYTQLPARSDASLDAKAPEGSRIAWRLRFDPQPQAATLQFHDGSRLALARSGDDWRAERVLATSVLYRVVPEGAPAAADDRLHRLDAVADLAPDVRVIQPEKTLTLLNAQQKTWDLVFEASDDFGLAHAELTLTLAQGTGENIAFKEQTIVLDGEASDAAGSARRQRYRHTLDLAALGIAKGDDVIVRIAVSDNREPKPNTTRSASFILRWPVDPSSESAGLEGIVQKAMPAYFRSQRQIIIDSEALLADKPGLDDAHFMARSDALGVDQKILRLRYGQFLGEESETHAESVASNASAKPTQVDALAAAHAAQERQLPTQSTAKFGEEGNTIAEYGHVHDIAEAATLLDADTKATLKSALNEMWQAELHLRQADPASALPYEHRALEFIKQVQQSTRIYLARVGLELPLPDEARRLSGERKDLVDRAGSLGATDQGDAAITQLWQVLATPAVPDWTTAETWLRAHANSTPDALGVVAAIDKAQRDPACGACRAQLRALLWPLLPVPAAVSALRAAPTASGRAYLDALPSATDVAVESKGTAR